MLVLPPPPPPPSTPVQSLYFSSLHLLSGHLLITRYIYLCCLTPSLPHSGPGWHTHTLAAFRHTYINNIHT